MADEKTRARQLAELWGDKPVKRKPGRPAGVAVPATFEDAMAELRPAEADFVRHVLAGKDQKEAYALAYPKARDPHGQQANGARLAARATVKRALALGRKAGAVTAIAGLAYDVKAADSQLVELIDEARVADQYSAVANLVRERLKLHKLTDNTPGAVAGASFTLIIRGQDGQERTINPAHVVDIQPVEEGSEK